MSKLRAVGVAMMIFGVAGLLLGACASMGARHVATVSIVAAHGVLSTVQDVEGGIVCGRPTAPQPPACVPLDVHRTIAQRLSRAFELDGRVAQLVRDVPPGAPQPADALRMVGDIGGIVVSILADIPPSPQKDSLISAVNAMNGGR